ncbi:MAG: hypothetical protein RJA29_706, partial [Pseudomonadota bacterium]
LDETYNASPEAVLAALDLLAAQPGRRFAVLGTMLGLPGFAYETIEEVRAAALPTDIASRLSNASTAYVEVAPAAAPVTASIYQLDGLVRRAPSLQATADAAGGH